MTHVLPAELAELVEMATAAGIPLPQDVLLPVEPTPGARRQSLYLTMRDGVRLALDVHLPPLPSGGRVPTCIRSTRYWRAKTDPVGAHVGEHEAARWTRHGFALVLLDVRGTGASFGTWPRPWDDEQRDDLRELVDWVVAQDWSDGTVGGYGTSYDGTTAHLLAATGHPAVTAVVPRFALYDSYHHVAVPGGVPLDWFTESWSAVNWTLDGYPERATCPLPLPLSGSVRPVDGAEELVEAAAPEHAANWDLWDSVRDSAARDDATGADGTSAEAGTPFGRIEELRKARVPMWLWSGWYDGAYAAAQLAQLSDPALDVRVTIGPFSHGAAYPPLGDPFFPQAPNLPLSDQVAQIAAFLRTRSASPAGAEDPSPARLRYWTLGKGWQDAQAWPPAGVVSERWHLGSAGDLSPAPGEGSTSYAVDFEASSGVTGTRWHTLLGGVPVTYPDRREADERLAVWEGPVLAADVEITGTPVVHLDVVSSRDDGAFHVYLEAVRPDGSVLYLTEGQLRALHRRPAQGPAPYETYGPWHTYLSEDQEMLEPGVPASLDMTLWPISAVVPAGWRLRVALAGADRPLFRRIPAEGEVALQVLATSWVDVPVQHDR